MCERKPEKGKPIVKPTGPSVNIRGKENGGCWSVEKRGLFRTTVKRGDVTIVVRNSSLESLD